jgi:hypothetical protein
MHSSCVLGGAMSRAMTAIGPSRLTRPAARAWLAAPNAILAVVVLLDAGVQRRDWLVVARDVGLFQALVVGQE